MFVGACIHILAECEHLSPKFRISSLLEFFFVLQPSLLVTSIVKTSRPQEASLHYQAQRPKNAFVSVCQSCSYNYSLESLWSLGSIFLWGVSLILISRAYFQKSALRVLAKIVSRSSLKSQDLSCFSCSLYRFLEHGEICGSVSTGSTCGFNPFPHWALWRLAMAIKSSATKRFGWHPLPSFRAQELIISLHSVLTCQFRKLHLAHSDLHSVGF